MEFSPIEANESSTGPAPVAPDRAATLVVIARLIIDSNLPAPESVHFRTESDGRHHLDLTFGAAEDAQAWGRHFGVDDGYKLDRVYQPEWQDDPIRSYSVYARPALGFASVCFTGWTSVDVEPVPVVDPDPALILSAADIEVGEPEHVCEGCGKVGRISRHEPGCPVVAAWAEYRAEVAK